MPEEAGSHVVDLGDGNLLMAASAPRSAELIADLGYTPVVVDISEFEKLEGCVTCLSVRLRTGTRTLLIHHSSQRRPPDRGQPADLAARAGRVQDRLGARADACRSFECTQRVPISVERTVVKKIINDPTTVTTEALQGMAEAHADLITVTLDPAFIVRADAPVQGKVALVSGGGSGHEPLHGGFVGEGMLAAAVPGPVFTSPTPDQVIAATQAANGGAGVLLIVKNYTGDVLNFETAAELAEAEGIEVKTVVIADDVAVKDSTWTAGRRGVGGTVLVEKIAGAAAARGDDLAAVTAIAERVSSQVRSMGMALTPCTVPHSGEPSFTLADDEMEMGVGIHGEPGRERVKLAPADEIVATLLDSIVGDLPFESGANTLLFVNGMGGTPQIELYLAYHSARKYLADKGIEVTRSLVGNYITSLEMQGMSITLLKLDDEMTAALGCPGAHRRAALGRVSR